jgi:hypothetical protein
MKTGILLLTVLLGAAGCGSHKGAIKPNAGLADFDKYGKAYYLSLDQIKLGDTQDQVMHEYGSDYEVVETKRMDGHQLERWRFTSYRATFARDPVDKYVFVSFKDQLVVGMSEELVGRSSTPAQTTGSNDPLDKLERLKRLLDQGAITKEEYETKKRELLNKM